MVYQMIPPVRGVAAPLALVLAAPADVAVTVLHVFFQIVLSQAREVTVDAADHEATCQRRSFVL